MTDTRHTLGQRGEQVAAQYLTEHGYTIRARNWRCRAGELDLVTEKDEVLIFVEVRTRRGDRLGTPEESITPAKRVKLIVAAQTYLDEHNQTELDWRIDVIAIEMGAHGEVKRCTLIENAIEET